MLRVANSQALSPSDLKPIQGQTQMRYTHASPYLSYSVPDTPLKDALHSTRRHLTTCIPARLARGSTMRRKPASPALKSAASAASEPTHEQNTKALSIVGLMMGIAPVSCALAIHLVLVLSGA